MSFDNQELEETRRRNGMKECKCKDVEKLIRKRIDEINNEEWFIPDEKNVKFYCVEELEKILFKLKED